MLAESPAPSPAHDVARGRDLARAGRVTAALQLLDDAADPPAEPADAVAILAVVLECRLARGELARAGRLGERIALFAEHGGLVGAVGRHALAELATARGDHDQAAGRYADAGRVLGGDADDPDVVPWRAGAALSLTRLGRHRDAHALAATHLDLAHRAGSPYAVAQALRTLATTNTDGGRVPLLREARAAIEAVPAERLAAQIDTDLAGLLTLQGDREAAAEAVGLLRRAEEYAGREDLFPLQDRVRRLLERLGQQPRRIRSETLATLTASEQKAARMAADGLSNREIAARMGVTVKAVEWHLSHVYRKLGIRNRTSLGATLGAPV